MIIKTKEDFYGKYIKLPINLSEKKFNKIKKKFKRLGFPVRYLTFGDKECKPYLYFDRDGVGNWTMYPRIDKIGIPVEISIKEFLKEEEEEFKIKGYNCIPNKFQVVYGKDLNEIKENLDKRMEGFSYGKPKKFEDGFEAMHWCIKNPFKEILVSYFTGDFKVRYSDIIQKFQFSQFVGTKFQKFKTLIDDINSLLKYWKDIKEYREIEYERKLDIVAHNLGIERRYSMSTNYESVDFKILDDIFKTKVNKRKKLKNAIRDKDKFKYKESTYVFFEDTLYRVSTNPKGIMFSVDSNELTNLIINSDKMVEIIEKEK